MLRLAADENFNNDIVRGVRRPRPEIRAEKPMPGVFEIGRRVPVGLAIDEIVLLAECSVEGEWEGQIRYLPLR